MSAVDEAAQIFADDNGQMLDWRKLSG